MKKVALNREIISVHFNGHADNVRSLRVFLNKPFLNKITFRESSYNMTMEGNVNNVQILNIYRLY